MALLIKKHMIKPFLNKGTSVSPDWVQIKKATEFTRTMNAVTEVRDYICDEMPTTEVTQYKPSESFSITTYKGEDDFDLFYALYKKRALGDEAKKELLLVSVFESVTTSEEIDGTEVSTDYYYAEKCNATITVAEFNFSSSTLTIDVAENGTPVVGYVKIVDGKPVFTQGDMPHPQGA